MRIWCLRTDFHQWNYCNFYFLNIQVFFYNRKKNSPVKRFGRLIIILLWINIIEILMVSTKVVLLWWVCEMERHFYPPRRARACQCSTVQKCPFYHPSENRYSVEEKSTPNGIYPPTTDLPPANILIIIINTLPESNARTKSKSVQTRAGSYVIRKEANSRTLPDRIQGFNGPNEYVPRYNSIVKSSYKLESD